MILVFDTETTGKADFRADFDAPQQPHIVQLGAQLLDHQYVVRGEINYIINPHVHIPKEASAVHGITNEVAEAYGIDTTDALQAFALFALKARVFVAHNFSFDSLIISAAWHRTNGDGAQWREGDQVQYCTMEAMTGPCNLPGPYGPKWPKLQEAHRHCFGEEFDGAHDAMADVRACARVYRWLMEQPVAAS